METANSTRKLKISLSHNKMEAYISISYSADSEGKFPPRFSVDELKRELQQAAILYGIKDIELENCVQQEEVHNLLVATGKMPVDEEDDTVELRFEVDNDMLRLNEDSQGRVDFKSIGAINSVLKGDIIAIRHPGKEGINGVDVTGKVIKPRMGKKVKLRSNQGTELKSENIIIATIDGKPCMKNNAFYVYTTHEVPRDVDLKTGNVAFLGDITVKGSVKEGMKVQSDNSVTIIQNVEKAEVFAKGQVIINGHVISSKIVSGGEDTDKLKEIDNLTLLENNLKELVLAIEEVKKFNLLGYNTTDGQIVKLLLESKFKLLPKICLAIVSQAIKNNDKDDIETEKILSFIRTKLIGLAPLNIKHFTEILQILEVIKNKIEFLKQNLSLPVNVKLAYCQDSIIESSGDIIFTGRGAYVSSITAHNKIYFSDNHSVVRGGIIKADMEIRCNVVGSTGGVSTKLITSLDGHIHIATAYENTTIIVGNRETVIEYPSRDVHAYLDKNYELIVDRLRL